MSCQTKDEADEFKRNSFILQDPPLTNKKDCPSLGRNQGPRPLALTKENKPKFTYKPATDVALAKQPGIKPYHNYIQDI